MILAIILFFNVAILALMALAIKRRNSVGVQPAKPNQDNKLSELRSELSALKQDNARKAKQIEELRESTKRRMRKEETGPVTTQTVTSAPAEQSFDLALKTVQQQAEQNFGEQLAQAKARFDEKVAKLEAQLGERKQRIEKSKKNLPEALMGLVDGMPEEVVLEMGKLIKKADHAEKLFAATRGKLQMSQERFAEMQKRYFGVCRELALATGQNLTLGDEEARDKAEDLLDVSDKGVQA